MGRNTLPEYKCINIETAQRLLPKQQGYAQKAYLVIKEAFDRGEAVVMQFTSVDAANRQKRNIASYAEEAGFDLMYQRDGCTMYMWLQKQEN
jgi:hypothetical protein